MPRRSQLRTALRRLYLGAGVAGSGRGRRRGGRTGPGPRPWHGHARDPLAREPLATTTRPRALTRSTTGTRAYALASSRQAAAGAIRWRRAPPTTGPHRQERAVHRRWIWGGVPADQNRPKADMAAAPTGAAGGDGRAASRRCCEKWRAHGQSHSHRFRIVSLRSSERRARVVPGFNGALDDIGNGPDSRRLRSESGPLAYRKQSGRRHSRLRKSF